MARSRQSTQFAQRTIDNADKYRAYVEKLHATNKMIAEHFIDGSSLMEALAPNNNDDDAALQFIERSKRRLKEIATSNAKRMKEIDHFVSAVSSLNHSQRKNDDNADDASPINYESAIYTALEQIRQNDDQQQQDIDTHPMVIELKSTLGETIRQDDDLEIVGNTNTNGESLKCPVTGLLYENPVKNKVCGHIYDKAGLHQVLKNRKCTCPVAGCTNRNLSEGQVAEDEEMKRKVKRFKMREEQERRKRELEEEVAGEEEMEEAGGFTMIQ